MKKIQELLTISHNTQDEEFVKDACGLVNDMLDAAAEYVAAVVKSETVRRWPNTGNALESPQARYAELDKARSICHNSLIGMVDSVNRLCKFVGCEPVAENLNSRVDYGDYAFHIVSEIFEDRTGK